MNHQVVGFCQFSQRNIENPTATVGNLSCKPSYALVTLESRKELQGWVAMANRGDIWFDPKKRRMGFKGYIYMYILYILPYSIHTYIYNH